MVKPTPVIRYQEFDGTDGLLTRDGQILAYAHGALIASTPAGDINLRELMRSYTLPALLPDLSFSQTAPRTISATVALSPWNLTGELTGVVTLGEEKHFWVASRCTHPDFRRADEVPAGQRPWARSTDTDGWEFLLPAPLQSQPDHVLTKRVTLTLETFVEAVRAGRHLPAPYRRELTNVFSAAAPMWPVNLPRIASLRERADSGRI